MAHPAFQRTDHRPWPIPERRWTWRQTWVDLLFAHWRVPQEQIRPHIPAGLQLDTFDGECWVGVIPFSMERVARRPFPFGSYFRELNVRTYVTDGEKPGVWFFSLDASDGLAVWMARRWFGLPYHLANMRMIEQDGRYSYTSIRRSGAATLRADYGPVGDVFQSEPGSLDHWLTERYCLYASHRKRGLVRAEIHHGPWPLQPAHAAITENTMTKPVDIVLPDEMPTVHFAKKIEVVVWPPERVT